MGKRKKSSRKPTQAKQKAPLDTAFTCLFCHHDKSVTVRLDRKEGVAQLVCKVCDQRYQSKVNHLTEPIDIYSEWIDAADAAQKDEPVARRPAPSSSRPAAAAVSGAESDDDED
ncbi:transcription elongation factor Elf1 like-domain-containing protein [Mycena floridula]|nr:transcription elongation factor Elf1 like-domain-containing protein [Mycena floridula]